MRLRTARTTTDRMKSLVDYYLHGERERPDINYLLPETTGADHPPRRMIKKRSWPGYIYMDSRYTNTIGISM